ncbi:DUF1614 domain-containing protein [Saccharolobus shibatae]|uniref:Putative integral membrane protein n=1 Tax=Saccharolobus shibatae TaxID=2286 RepID=A0A8F5BSF9_9CREN|nr:DUF1614 domain-containing protein [Saccharolobus shibatae]QXJ30636.1 putative integral membrane protein [Saccharolobus shibatae]QXJ33664.1 putative integral membrane protein [Saccharolobus shibatae]
MRRIIVLSPFRGLFRSILYFLLGLIMALISAGYFSQLFSIVGINKDIAIIVSITISFLSLFSSPFNLVLKEVKKEAISIEEDVVFFFGFPVFIPRISKHNMNTLIAINLGGALIPLAVSLFLMYELQAYILYFVINIIIVAVASKLFSRVIRGVGVIMHPIIPSVFSVITSYFLFYRFHILIPLSAYIGSVVGTLIGADLLNLRRIINEARPQVISIGGMGTFDGIFVSGIISVFISELLII